MYNVSKKKNLFMGRGREGGRVKDSLLERKGSKKREKKLSGYATKFPFYFGSMEHFRLLGKRGGKALTHLCHNSSVSLGANSVCLATSCSASRLEIQDASSPFPRDAQKLVSPLFPFPFSFRWGIITFSSFFFAAKRRKTRVVSALPKSRV